MADQTFRVKCGFFDSVGNDRLYSADQMNLPYNRLISNGIFAAQDGSASTDFAVQSANNGMHITVKKGQGLFADKWFISDSDLDIVVPSNSGGSSRVDSVIIQVDTRTSGRFGAVVYRTGGQTVPEINTNPDIKEYRLANVFVAVNANEVVAGNITDLRGTDGCPWVTSLVYQPDNSYRIDEFLRTYGVNNATRIDETTLFSSNTPVINSGSPSPGVAVSADITSFNYVDIRYAAFGRTGIVRFKGSDIRTYDASSETGSHWSEFNRTSVRDPEDDSTPLEKVDFLLEKIDATHIWWQSQGWAWDGKAGSVGKAVELSQTNNLGIFSITGVNYVNAGSTKDPELTDIRVGYDGAVYPTAGDAVRGQATQAATAADAARDDAIAAKDTSVEAATAAVEAKDDAIAAVDGLEELVQRNFIYETASGSVASFTDGGDNLPIKSVSVDVDPVQDLHGYTKPWTGGAGKNLLSLTVDGIKEANGGASSWSGNSKTINDVTFTINTDSSGNVTGIKANGTASVSTWLVLSSINDLAAETYILNGTPPTGTSSTYYLALTDSTIGFTPEYGSGVNIVKGASDTGRIGINIRMNYNANNLVFKPMVRLASVSDATFEPYSNICLITGHTSAAITREGADSSQTQTYNITFPTAAGTVYGGTLDLNAGRLTVDKANIASYSGQSINTPWLSSMDEYAAGRTPTTGAQVVYPLATPITYNLTAEEITTLLGINHIWADTGDVSVEYAADPKLYINKVIANALNA